MKIFKEKGNADNIVEILIKMVEQETSSKVFTLRVLNEKEESENILALIVFADKRILDAVITVETINGDMTCRIRGNFI